MASTLGPQEALQYASDFFSNADVHRATNQLARALDELRIPYALMSPTAYGSMSGLAVVDVLLTRDGLAAFKARHLGSGYVEKFSGSRGVRDTESNVPINVVLAGDYPGDGKPKPVAFPDPTASSKDVEGLRLLPLDRFIELMLASGISAPGRLKDLADVLELIRLRALPHDFAEQLDPSVREKFRELWEAAQYRDDE